MSSAPGAGAQAVAAGPSAPSFNAVTLTGAAVRIPQDYAGKLVLVDFWATWCPPCRAEIPHLVQVNQRFAGRNFEIIGVTLDASQNVPVARVEQFVAEQKMTWPQVYRDAGQIAARFGVSGIPAAFLVDGRTGVILASGDELRGDALVPTIEKHLAGRKP
jgi:thiol-disulfide isomerase/thioredoxin